MFVVRGKVIIFPSERNPGPIFGVIGLVNAGDLGMVNGNSETYVAYVFKEIQVQRLYFRRFQSSFPAVSIQFLA